MTPNYGDVFKECRECECAKCELNPLCDACYMCKYDNAEPTKGCEEYVEGSETET